MATRVLAAAELADCFSFYLCVFCFLRSPSATTVRPCDRHFRSNFSTNGCLCWPTAVTLSAPVP